MGKCVNHTERETGYRCSKHGQYYCEECLECRDPKLYCKFRTACPIWFLEKEAKSGSSTVEETEPEQTDETRSLSCKQ